MGFRAIERLKGVHHTTMIHWVKSVGTRLPNANDSEASPEVAEPDELETFVGSNNKIWLWRAVGHFRKGILGWVIGDRRHETFHPLWQLVKSWGCYFYVTDGWPVYGHFIADEDHIVSKRYMTRVKSEHTRLRHYRARLYRKTLCYSKSVEMLR